MKLSIIIPVYNAEKYLRLCLDSIGEKIFDRNIDIIVFDDKSRDDSWNILLEYPERNCISFDHNSYHLGVSYTRNRGIDYAEGDYITFLDADDEYLPGAINNMLEAIRRYPDADMIQFNHLRLFNENGKPLQKFNNPERLFTAPDMPQLWAVCWNKVYKAELIEDIRFNTKLNHGEDELFVLECLKKAKKIQCVNMATVMHRRTNHDSLTHNVTEGDLAEEQYALMQYLCSIDDPALRQVVRERMTELWQNPTYKKVFGKDDTK